MVFSSRGGSRISSRGGGGALKKLRRAEEDAKILGVFRVKNHYFTPKNHSFYNYGGRREKCWGISCEKSRFYAKKTYFFPILGGACTGCAPPPPPPLDPPLSRVFIMSYFQGISIISCPKKIMQALTSRFNKPLALHYTYTSMLINAALHY